MSDTRTPSGYRIEQALSAWASARARLLNDDSDLAHDEAALSALLGPAEGDVEDILARLLRGAQYAASMSEAAHEIASANKDRSDRYKRRSEAMRATAFSILDSLGRTRVELPDLTVSVVHGAPSLIITNEATIPAAFIRVKREPDKAAILAELKAGKLVEGAVLGNSLPRLQVRSK